MQLLLKFNVSEEQIAKLTRWHRIAMIRKLSSEQAESGVKVDPTTVSKFARGQRMSFLQLQQQTREKCQEIWDRQAQSLCPGDGEENESESEANSDLDSFAGDLENLLDAEEGEEDNYESKHDSIDGVRGLKMRRHPFQTQVEEEIEDEAAEAAELCRMLMDGTKFLYVWEFKLQALSFANIEKPPSCDNHWVLVYTVYLEVLIFTLIDFLQFFMIFYLFAARENMNIILSTFNVFRPNPNLYINLPLPREI